MAEPARSGDLRNYALVTGAYWADTIADGAMRVLVLFYFYERGYSPFEVASLFLFYELFGIVTNLVGGWLAARLGLRSTLLMGLATQLVALGMLAFAPSAWLVVPYVMAAQALSGIAKDLTKMSSKSAVKLVAPGGCARRAVPLGRGPHRLEERAEGRRASSSAASCSTVAGFRPALAVLMALVLAALVVVLRVRCGAGSAGPTAGRSSRRCSRTTARSTSSPPRGSSCSRRATSGSSWVCPSSCAPSSAGASGRPGRSSRSG